MSKPINPTPRLNKEESKEFIQNMNKTSKRKINNIEKMYISVIRNNK